MRRFFIFLLPLFLLGCGEETYQDRQREKRLRKFNEQVNKLSDEDLNNKMRLNDWKDK
jgi:hypothetical protein